jgi:hypothetical protein
MYDSSLLTLTDYAFWCGTTFLGSLYTSETMPFEFWPELLLTEEVPYSAWLTFPGLVDVVILGSSQDEIYVKIQEFMRGILDPGFLLSIEETDDHAHLNVVNLEMRSKVELLRSHMTPK